MKKQSGFTLIELVVAMAVLGLIMGAMVHLFGSSVTSLHVGARQEVVYEEARLLMNELKTTLRYADKDSIDPEQPTVSTSKFSYKGNLWDRHMDIAQGTNKEYKVTVNNIYELREPIAECHMLLPQAYLGNVITLCAFRASKVGCTFLALGR